MLLKILFPALFLVGFYFLIKSIGKILRIYGGKKIEFPVKASQVAYVAEEAGDFEIAYKRPALTGAIPTAIPFILVNEFGEAVRINNAVNHFGSRKDLAGNRIVPIASFTINNPGTYHLSIPAIPATKEKDALQIGKATGSKGFVMIFAIVFSAIATIGGFVLTILAFLGKLQ